MLQENFSQSNALWHESGTHSSGYFPDTLIVLQKWTKKRERSSPTDVTVCNFEDKGTFYCVVSILLCRAPWTVVAFTWEIGLVVSLGSISQLAVSLIQSSAMVLALQYQGCSSRGLLCEERKGVIILRPPNHGGVTGFAFWLPLTVSTWGVRSSGIGNSKARLA